MKLFSTLFLTVHIYYSISNAIDPGLMGTGNVRDFTLYEKQKILDNHNFYRGKCANGDIEVTNKPLSASNMIYLFWDNGLEELAKIRASWCYHGHFNGDEGIRVDYEKIDKNKLTFYPPNGIGKNSKFFIGENIAIYNKNTLPNVNDVTMWLSGIEAWFRENKFFDWRDPWSKLPVCNSQDCGHFRQLCNAETRYVGCAVAECPNIVNKRQNSYDDGAIILACNYFPGQYKKYPWSNGYGGKTCYACLNGGDCKVCRDTLCYGGKCKSIFLNEYNNTIDQCVDGVGRNIEPCQLVNTYPPSKGSKPTPPTTKQPTKKPTTPKPTTKQPTKKPITPKPTTARPTTEKPTTAKPTTAKPTTLKPTTKKPTTKKPTKQKSTTKKPTTKKPTKKQRNVF